MKKTLFTLMAIVAIAAMFLTACGTARGVGELTQTDVIKTYNGLIVAYQNAQKEAANGASCLVLVFTEINYQSTLANNYMAGQVAMTDAYRKALAEFGTKMTQVQTQFNDQAQAYVDANGQPIDPSTLDLAVLESQGALPSNMGLTLQVYATTFTEAPMPPMNAEPILTAQRAVSEKMNQAFACIKTWNDTVGVYNQERQQVPGDVVGTLANYLHVKELPATLPYFTLQGPTAPQPLPTFGAPS